MSRSMLMRFIKCESGGTAIEYGLIATFLSLVIVAGIALVTDAIEFQFSDSTSKLNQAINTGGG